MIILTKEAKVSQSRDVRPKYAEPHEATPENWGKPVDMIASEVIQCEAHLCFSYDKDPESRKIADAFLKAARELIKASTSFGGEGCNEQSPG